MFSITSSLTPLGLQPEVSAWSGVLSNNNKKKNPSKQTIRKWDQFIQR